MYKANLYTAVAYILLCKLDYGNHKRYIFINIFTNGMLFSCEICHGLWEMSFLVIPKLLKFEKSWKDRTGLKIQETKWIIWWTKDFTELCKILELTNSVRPTIYSHISIFIRCPRPICFFNFLVTFLPSFLLNNFTKLFTETKKTRGPQHDSTNGLTRGGQGGTCPGHHFKGGAKEGF